MENVLFKSSDSSSTDDERFASFRKGSSSKNRNPALESLEQHSVKFPVETKTKSFSEPTLSASSTIYRCAPSNKQEELEQLNMVLNHSILEQQHHQSIFEQQQGQQQQPITYPAAHGSIPIQYFPTPVYYPPTFPVYTPSQTAMSSSNLPLKILSAAAVLYLLLIILSIK